MFSNLFIKKKIWHPLLIKAIEFDRTEKCLMYANLFEHNI